MPERLIVLNGAAGAGKTTLAVPLASYLGVPLVSKDALKEALADTVPASLPTRQLGGLATDALWRIVAMLPGTVMVESVWLAGRDEQWFHDGWHSVGAPPGVEVWCEAPRAVMRQRFLTRPRHSAHDDANRIDEWECAAAVARPMTGLPVIRVDTGEPVDVANSAAQIRALLPGS